MTAIFKKREEPETKTYMQNARHPALDANFFTWGICSLRISAPVV